MGYLCWTSIFYDVVRHVPRILGNCLCAAAVKPFRLEGGWITRVEYNLRRRCDCHKSHQEHQTHRRVERPCSLSCRLRGKVPSNVPSYEFLPIRATCQGENENFSIDVTMHFVGWNSHFTWGTMYRVNQKVVVWPPVRIESSCLPSMAPTMSRSWMRTARVFPFSTKAHSLPADSREISK